jgi:DNA-binding NtrC family response regulator
VRRGVSRRAILIVDDDPLVGRMLLRSLTGFGWDLEYVQDPETAAKRIETQTFDLVITDFKMAKLDGMQVLERLKEAQPDCEAVIVSGYPSVEVVRRAFKLGAADFLQKPFSPKDELIPLVQFLLGGADADGDADDEAEAEWPPGLVARSAAMRSLLVRLRKVGRSDATVLLQGESGSGKSEVANVLHGLGARVGGPFVRVNCAAIPDNLIEAELFGHAKGAFTGADRAREGVFQAADGGTLFLDEIGELPLSLQPKLLRALEQGEFNRIGEPHNPIRVDVRLVAATNRDLEDMVRRGRFRQDLYYRLNVVALTVPALRDRREDLDALVDHFLALAGATPESLSEEARDALHAYDWPGNVRELRNALEHALIMAEDKPVATTDLPDALQARPARAPDRRGGGTLEEIEIRSILEAMAKSGYNQTRAAALLGVTRRVMGYRIKKYGLAAELEELRRLDGRPAVRVPSRAAARRTDRDRA